ncbi:MAG TPA: hypothetical protein PLC92_04355, partial [Chitinophagales bacterium]|nr:hypothetical protein [Chitinophagales bacterium]
MEQFVYLIPLFPLISFAIIALSGKSLPKKITTYLAPSSILASFVVAFLIFVQLISQPKAITVPLFT